MYTIKKNTNRIEDRSLLLYWYFVSKTVLCHISSLTIPLMEACSKQPFTEYNFIQTNYISLHTVGLKVI